MSSGNAFARLMDGPQQLPADDEEEAEVRPGKRARISELPVAAFQVRSAQEETALEVDIMILDYLAYQATQECLGSRDGTISGGIESALASLDISLAHFKAQHASYKPDAELRFRISLARLAALYTQRMTWGTASPSEERLQSMREANRDRVKRWIGERSRIPSLGFDPRLFDEELPLSSKELERGRARVLRELELPPDDGAGPEEVYYGAPDSVSLLDILPLFMQVSATGRAMTACNLNQRWIELACELMLQACLEQYLVFGASGTDAVDEAFAWGYKDPPSAAEAAETAPDAMSAVCSELFRAEDETGREDQGWSNTRRSYLARLFPTSRELGGVQPSSLASHLATLAAAHPLPETHAALSAFLQALSMSIDEPVLVQLETGKLVGMDERQTRHFIKACGLMGNGQRFFDHPVGFKGA